MSLWVEKLKEYNGDYKKLFKQDMIRSYGVFAFIRDDYDDYTEEELKQKLVEHEKEFTSRYQEKQEEVPDEEEIKKDYETYLEENEKRLKDNIEESKVLVSYINKLDNLKSTHNTVNELLHRLRTQLTSEKVSCENNVKNCAENLSTTYEQYRQGVIDSVERHNNYIKQQQEKLQDRESLIDFYNEFVKAVNNLGE